MKCSIFFNERWRYLICSLLCLCFGALNTLCAQNQKMTVTGTVLDELGQPLPGANVVEQGTINGVSVDFDGIFTIEVLNSNAVLEISYIGYQTQKIQVTGKNNITVQMQLDASQLDEIVVIGYGTQKKKLNTGATLQVKGEDLADRLKTNPLNALQGQSPGVTIATDGGQPGAPTKVFIRGMGTIGSTTPLFIVDGVQTESIDYLNSNDIESMDVLKDAASAAIYGSRASNGVVLITTKKGIAGQAQITFDTYYGMQSLAKRPDLLNAQEYAMLMNEKFENSGDTPFFVGEKMDQITAMGEGTNWIDVMFKDNVPTQNYSLGLSGGSIKSVYSTALSYTEQGGILGGESQNNLKRVTFKINSEHKFYDDILKVGENMTVTHVDLQGGLQNGRNNYVYQALAMPPILQNTDENGDFVDNSTGLLADFGAGGLANPYAIMVLNNQQKSKTFKVLGNFYAELQPFKDLRIRSSIGTVFEDQGYRRYTPKYPPLGQFNNPSTRPFDEVFQSDNKSLQVVWTNTVAYRYNLNNHEFDMVLGSESQKTDGEYLAAGNKNLIFQDYEHAYLDNALGKNNEGLMSVSGYPMKHRLLSYFGRINYNYKEKYLLNATLRSDGSSNFSKENRRGYFPSVSGGWVLTNEPFMEPTSSWLTSFKFRASWGQNGNQNLPPFRYLATVTSNSIYSLGTQEDGFLASGAQIDRMANPDLKWEISEQTNIGFDAALFENKFAVNFDYYRKSTNGWLLSPPISSVIGLAPPWINGGNVINEGVELALTYKESLGDFNFDINLNGAYNKNNVTEVPNDIIHGPGGSLWDNSQEYFRTETGKPLGYYWMLETDGLFQNTADVSNYVKDGTPIQPSAVPGDLKYVDQNDDGIINDEDRINVGDPFPDFVYGINLNLNYKDLNLMVNANGMAGLQIVQAYYNYARYFPNYTTEALGRWHGEGTSNHYPRLDKANTNWTNNSDIYVYDGDFLRLSNITLSYDMTKLVNLKPLTQFRVFASVLNAYTFTKYPGMDPEVGQGPDYEMGHDVGFVPNPRTIMVGANIKL
ncbi:TonB-dependent receptor SusC [Arenibacter algicola]|uniref:TonB-dependent receptor SusC n=2 Tax=Arenibacter algicola TaxID=616991 RepID=A0A221V1E7_9FLAO|nr:TonB-dependent receptor SusC [Arenibacter algicola]